MIKTLMEFILHVIFSKNLYSLYKLSLIDTKHAEVYPCKCDTDKCTYKQQWVDAGSPFRIPIDVAIGKQYMPLVSEWMQTKYCNRKGEY